MNATEKSKASVIPVMLGGHSGLEPPLPISNRAVKRTSANDSMLFACESRSLPSYSYQTPLHVFGGVFLFLLLHFHTPQYLITYIEFLMICLGHGTEKSPLKCGLFSLVSLVKANFYSIGYSSSISLSSSMPKPTPKPLVSL